MLYLFDANILMEANNRYYGLDFAPGFWDVMEKWLIVRKLGQLQ